VATILRKTSDGTVSLAALVEDSGESARTLQHWSDLGILKPLPATSKRGRGYHRAFRAEPFYGERVWALLASALNKLRIPLGDIKLIIDHLRKTTGLNEAQDKRGTSLFRASPFYQALTSHNPTLVLVRVDATAEEGKQLAVRFFPPIRPEMFEIRETGFVARSPSLEEIVRDQLTFLGQHGGRAHLLDLAEVFRPLRP
jgi:DNA-binding transcriptional MerR regulator